MTRRQPRGRLVTPSPGLEAIYTALGGSNTHCEVYPGTGGTYTCLSVDPYNDRMRHEDPQTYDVQVCAACQPVGVPLLASPGVLADRLAGLAAELSEIAQAIR